MNDKDKALLIMEKSYDEFKECKEEIKKLHQRLLRLNIAFENANALLKRCLNEEENEGNIHKECEYYYAEKDYCSNNMMGEYCGLAFEVSRHPKCIKDLVKE